MRTDGQNESIRPSVVRFVRVGKHFSMNSRDNYSAARGGEREDTPPAEPREVAPGDGAVTAGALGGGGMRAVSA